MEIIFKKENPVIGLNMIVKNEGHIIKETLEKLHSQINFGYWVISDTGSTDQTCEIITEFFKEKDVPGELYHDTWKDFGYNRTKALEHAYNKTDYLLIFDADDEICGDFKLPDLIFDAYHFKFGNENGCGYKRVLLVNNRIQWKYVGVLHEYITCLKEGASFSTIEGNYYTVSGRKGNRSQNPDKYLHDAIVLENGYKEAIENNDPIYMRYAFYCANSFMDAGKHEKAIEWYKTTLEKGNWDQEKYVSCIRLYEAYLHLKQEETGFYYLVKASFYDNERVEHLVPLITHYVCINMHKMAYSYYEHVKDFYENKYLEMEEMDKLFVDTGRYKFFLPYYMILVSEKLKKYETGILMYKIVFTKKFLFFNTWWIGNILFNLQFFIDKISPEDTEFIKLFKQYIDFLKENGYNLQKHECMKNYEKYGIFVEKESILNIQPMKFSINDCKLSKKILFFTGYHYESWNYSSRMKTSLGGSETAVAYLASKFPKNYEIYVSGAVNEEKVDNVTYIHFSNLRNLIENNCFHTIIISRYISFLDNYPLASSYKTFLWAHDTHLLAYGCNISDVDILEKYKDRIDGCICLSQWHKSLFEQFYPVLHNKIFIINNGINTELFPVNNIKKSNKFIYSSCSERGLKILLQLWPTILENLPDAELVISSYKQFPSDAEDENMKTIIDKYESITHLGRLSPSELYAQMSTAEYWLFPSIFSETSCITALEMLMTQVICIYYPLAGLENTIGDYGIRTSQNNEIEALLNITIKQKIDLKIKGKKYAESCSWENRVKEWSHLMFNESYSVHDNNILLKKPKKELTEFTIVASHSFIHNVLDEYIESLRTKYTVDYVVDINKLLETNPSTVIIVNANGSLIEQLIRLLPNSDICILNTEPLNLTNRLEDIINKYRTYSNIKIYDYSLSNIKILLERGIQNVEHLPYLYNEKENSFLRKLNENTEKIYDFGVLMGCGAFSKNIKDLSIKRKHVVEHLLAKGYTVNLIYAWKEERDTELAKCKIILNIHGHLYINNVMLESKIFEHVRCNRLLDAGFRILSEDSLYLEENFVHTYPNLKMMNYNSFFKINFDNDVWNNIDKLCLSKTKRKIIDCFTFYNEIDMLKYRLNTLNEQVDYFVLVEATLTHAGHEKEMYFEKNKHFFSTFKDKIIHIIVDDFPYNKKNISYDKNEQWVNERHQRNCIKRGLSRLDLKEEDLIIIADVDEIPDPCTLYQLKSSKTTLELNRFEQDFYYYNLNCKRQEKWYHSKILSFKKYNELNLDCDNIRFLYCDTIPKGGWHLSYFGSPDFVKNKLIHFAHQEYNSETYTNENEINNKIKNCADLFNRNTPMDKVKIKENTYLPPMYNKYLTNYYEESKENPPYISKKYCFIHSCNLENVGTYRLEYLINKLNTTGCIDIFEKVFIINLGIPIENDFGDKFEVTNYTGDINVSEFPTINKIQEFSNANPNDYILYLHTKGIRYGRTHTQINDWIDMMLYFTVEQYKKCVAVLDQDIQVAGSDYLVVQSHNVPPHYSGNFWWATTNYLKTLEKLPEESFVNRNDAEFWLFKNNPRYFVCHSSNVNHYYDHYPRERYVSCD
jgi:beta-1,4-mannosyl-glycoprotein beta-1,4-N-acetylglucosaminyltransferase